MVNISEERGKVDHLPIVFLRYDWHKTITNGSIGTNEQIPPEQDCTTSLFHTNEIKVKSHRKVIKSNLIAKSTDNRLAQLAEHRTIVREVRGSTPGRTTTQGLKIIEEMLLPLFLYLQMVRSSRLLG
ncbi:hypothetical protein AC249_AIPGENE23876 [Exaiptasia diaphana]|nr:hypothetical protein AC249_AIPGENE23876 [Exaiptasia diaphana]